MSGAEPRKFLLGGGNFRAHSEREDFAKSARRDVIDSFHMKMHLHWGN